MQRTLSYEDVTHYGKIAYADFTLGVSRTKDQKTLFPIRVFGKLAETCDNIKKGIRVLVDGKLDISEYTDKEGRKRPLKKRARPT